MKPRMLWALVATLAFPAVVVGQDGPDVLSALEGRWSGDGTLMGRSARFEMTWTRVLNGRFLRLEFRNAFADVDPVQTVLEADAYYRLGGAELTGSWMDTRGVILSLRATVGDSELVTDWTGSESGRTTYRVIDSNTVEVVDLVRSGDEWREFAVARYQRTGGD